MNNAPRSLSLLPAFENRYILTQLGTQQLAFPAPWVTEIMVVERSHILTLPFYDRALLGLVHHQGHLVPLVMLPPDPVRSPTQPIANPASLIAIRCSQSVAGLAGVGIVVDQVIGNITAEQLTSSEANPSREAIQVFRPDIISPHLWQPQ